MTEVDLRQDYLFANDPFDSRARALAWTVLAALFAAADSDFEEFDARIPLASLTFLGLCSAWARWNARRFDGAALRRRLARSENQLRWVLPGGWILLGVLVLGYAFVLWRRWVFWHEALGEDGSSAEAYGGWGSLLFQGRDLSLLILGGVPALLLVWVNLRLRPRLRAALARA